MKETGENLIDNLNFDKKGLIPAVLQNINTKEVLMVAYMNRDSLKKTLESRKACFWSRSRQELWLKGETSGNYQQVKEIRIDCDNDTLLLLVESAGPACHTGENTCFYRDLSGNELKLNEDQDLDSDRDFQEKALFLKKLYKLIEDRKNNPVEGSYTNYLFEEGIDKICKKIGEEAAEVIIGSKNGCKGEIVYETGDLIYHLFVLLNNFNIPLEDILNELEKRSK